MRASAYESSAYGLKYIFATNPEYFMNAMKLEEEEEEDVKEFELLKKQQRELERVLRKQEQEQGQNPKD
jgi:hypothetical protein